MENSVHSSPFKGNKSNNENELNSETASKIKSPRKKQLPPKNFMNPTISASIRASTPRKKILGERNESEPNSLRRSSSFDSNTLKSSVIDSVDDVEKDSVDKPYDPVTNFLSPRPKFLRYNPNRRRNIVNLQENSEDLVKISTYYDAGNGSTVTSDSCSQQESVEDTVSVKNEEDEVENGEECESEDEEEEEEMVEIEDGGCCSLRGVFKFLCVVAAVILTAHAICSMKCPSPSQTVESVWGDRVFGLNSSEAVEYGQIKEPDLLVGRLEVGDAVDYGGFEMVEDYAHQDEVENDETSVTRDETLEEHETEASEVVEIDDAEAEEDHDFNEDGASKVIEIHDAEVVEEDHEFNKDGVIEEDESDADDTEFDAADAMEDGVEKEIKRASFDPTVEVLVAPMLVLISFVVVYRLKYAKVRKEESKELKPSANAQSTKQKKEQEPLQNKEEEDAFVPSVASLAPQSQTDISNEIASHIHTPSVELLSEFTFGEEEELTSTTKHSNNSLIHTTALSSSQTTKTSHMETSTADSAKKQGQRRRNAEIVTPSPVRRSSRLKSRSITSP